MHEANAEIPPRISELVNKMMAVELDDRFQTMDEVAAAIQEILAEEKQ